jgi:hypothetical protein
MTAYYAHQKENADKLLLDHLHWQNLRDNTGNSNSHHLLALATLGIAT